MNHWWPFKVGDRVRIRRCAIVDFINKPGTIVETNVYDLSVGYIVDIDGEGRYSFYDYHDRPLSVEFLSAMADNSYILNTCKNCEQYRKEIEMWKMKAFYLAGIVKASGYAEEEIKRILDPEYDPTK